MKVQFKNQAGGVVQFSDNVVEIFSSFRQLGDNKNEAGGVIIGRTLLNKRDYIVDQVTTPSTEDRSSKYTFFRSLRIAQKFVVSSWKRSGGIQNYLGEWHSHPEDIPSPSAVDIANWKRIRAEAKGIDGHLFFVIVGRVETKLWSLSQENGSILECPVIQENNEYKK